MAGEENWQYHRSPSSPLQGLHDQSSLMSNGSNKSQQKQSTRKKASTSLPVSVPVPVPVQKSASEKLSWFTSSPLLLRSPAREGMVKKKGGGKRSTAMFSARVRGGRGRYEEEEAAAAREDEEDPTSPTVSCIGQVKPCRSKAMSKGPSSSSMASGASRESVSSEAAAASTSSSPARFFMSPARGRHSTWTSFFGSPRKVSSASSAGHGHGHGHEDMQDSKRSLWATVFRKHNQHAGGEEGGGWDGIMNGVPSHISAASSSSSSSANNADMKCQIRNAIPAGHGRVPSSKLHGGPPTSAQHGVIHKSTYEELPPLQSGICNIQDLKVSLEVVPETWLAGDGERLRSGAARAQPCLPDRSMEEEDDQVPLAQEGQVFRSSAFSSINQDAQAIAQTLQRASCDGEAHTIEASGTQSKDAEKQKTTTTTSTMMKKKIFFLGSTADSRRSHPSKTKKPGSDSDGGELDKKRFDHTGLYEKLAKSFGTLIVVGYDLNENAASHELAPASGEKLFAGAFQVAGFNEAGRRYLKLFQAGNAEFIRSRSVTSQRKTVMRLQRCNSEPWKPSN